MSRRATGCALALSRSVENVAEPCSAISPAFPAAPGQWEIRLAGKADMGKVSALVKSKLSG